MTVHDATGPSWRRRAPLTAAALIGIGLGPLLAWGAVVAGPVPPVLTTALLCGMSAIGIAGLVVSAARWRSAARRMRTEPAGATRSTSATRFLAAGQRSSFALAVLELLILIVAAPLVLVLHLTGPRGTPSEDFGAILVAAAALTALSALVVPTVAAQIAWTWTGETARAEAAVLAGLVPGRRRTIAAARAVAVTAWLITTAGAVTLSGFALHAAADRARAVRAAYSASAAAAEVRGELLEDYVVGDVRCPAALRDPARESTLTCRVTSLGEEAGVRATWTPSGYGTGSVAVVPADLESVPLTRTSELGDRIPTAVPPGRELPDTEVEAAVRDQLRREGWSSSSRAVRLLRCPGIGRGYGPGLVRCTIGGDPETQRTLDVYPVRHGHLVARAAEIADLPR